MRRPVVSLTFVCLTGLSFGLVAATWSSLRSVNELAGRFRASDELVHVLRRATGESTGIHISRPEYADWRARNDVFSEMAAIRSSPLPRVMDTVALGGSVVRLRPLPVTVTYFPLLGIAPTHGRVFVPADTQRGAAPVVILSRRAAEALFRRAEMAVGQAVRMADAYESPPATVVGVVEDEARLRLIADYDVYLPLAADVSVGESPTARLAIEFEVIGRLRPGVTVQESEARLGELVRGLAQEYPIMPGTGVVVTPLSTREFGDATTVYRYLVFVALAAVAVVGMTMICMCVSTAATRRVEFAVRRACGATGKQLSAQLAAEASLLALASGGVAVLVSVAGTSWLSQAIPVERGLGVSTTPDGASLLAGAMGILFVALAWWITAATVAIGRDADAATRLRRERWRWLDWTVGVHATLVLACLVPTLAVVAHYRGLLQTPLGFDPARITAANVLIAPMQLNPDRFGSFATALLERLQADPQIERSAIASGVPLEEPAFTVRVTGQADDWNARVLLRSVSSDYFSVLGIPLIAGRVMSDQLTPCEVVVSSGFADTGPFQPELGSLVVLGGTRCEVVGIAAPVREGPLTGPRPVLYRAFTPDLLPASLWILARARPGQTIATGAISTAVTASGGDLTVEQLPLAALVDRATASGRFYSAVLAVASIAALGLVAISVFSLLTHAVRSRRRELAIRTALGGAWSHVSWIVARRVMMGLAVGTVAGVGTSYGALRVVSHLSTISAGASSEYAAWAIGLLWLSGVLAAVAPVVSAVRVHPSVALKNVP